LFGVIRDRMEKNKNIRERVGSKQKQRKLSSSGESPKKKRKKSFKKGEDTKGLVEEADYEDGMVEMKQGSIFTNGMSTDNPLFSGNGSKSDYSSRKEENPTFKHPNPTKPISLAKKMLIVQMRKRLSSNSTTPKKEKSMIEEEEEEEDVEEKEEDEESQNTFTATTGGQLLEKGGISNSIVEFQLEFALVFFIIVFF